MLDLQLIEGAFHKHVMHINGLSGIDISWCKEVESFP